MRKIAQGSIFFDVYQADISTRRIFVSNELVR